MTRIKTTFDPVKGVFQEAVSDGDEQVIMQRNAEPTGFQLSSGIPRTKTLTTNSGTLTVADAGAVIVSSSNGSKNMTVVMPTAATCAGTLWTVRTTSADAQRLTASQDTGKPFTDNGLPWVNAANKTGSSGASLTLPATVNSSVALMCDGVNWVVIGSSGSCDIH